MTAMQQQQQQAARGGAVVRCQECNGQILDGKTCLQCGRTPKPAAAPPVDLSREPAEQARRAANLRAAMRRSFSRQEADA